MNKSRIYYFISTALSMAITIVSIFNINELFNDFFKIKKEYDIDKCMPFLIWKFSLIFNIFFFFANFGFLGYLIFKRNTNYNRVIYIKIGPTLDTVILIFLTLSCIIFGPALMIEIILMTYFYNQIMCECDYSKDDPYKIYYYPYIILASILAIIMIAFLIFILSRRCSRRRLLIRRNITNIGELINII
jgi:hypothetical protein